MKVVKLTKKMLRMHPADLLIELGAINNGDFPRTFPQHVYISKEDYKLLKKNLIDKVKKRRGRVFNKIDAFSVNADLFNFGPNQNLEDAIRPGYVLVDEEGINVEIVKAKLNS